MSFSFLLKLMLSWEELTPGRGFRFSVLDDVTKGWFPELCVLVGLTAISLTGWQMHIIVREHVGPLECATF